MLLIFKQISILLLKLLGWRLELELPKEKKYVVIGAPHTSNWDFPLTLLTLSASGLRFSWVAKHTMFKGISGSFFRAIGGIPVNRKSSHGFIDQMVAAFNDRDRLILTIAPEGTRSWKNHWKTGFYHIARRANVPVCMGFMDYPSKTIGLNKTFMPSGNISDDFEIIKDYYKGKTGRRPQQQSTITFRERKILHKQEEEETK